MLMLIARRVLGALPILIGVLFLAMFLVELMPGDPAAIMSGENASPETVELTRKQLRLDEPLYERFGRYTWAVLHGDLGHTPGAALSVRDRIAPTLAVTLSLAIVAIVFAVVVGVAAGTVAALRRGKFVDRSVTAISSVMLAIPPFCIGLALVVFLAVNRTWFPTGGYVPLRENPWEWLHHLILPGITLGLFAAAELARQTRSALLDTLEQDYIRALRAKGLPERKIIAKHAAKNSATPVITVLGLQVGRILGGAVVVELIFALPGFGALALGAVLSRDVLLIQGVVLVSAIAVLLSNLVVDVAYGYLNPRTRS